MSRWSSSRRHCSSCAVMSRWSLAPALRPAPALPLATSSGPLPPPAANAAAAFKCPMCLGVCACQLLKGGKAMERHKRAGWVGVTGNHDPTCSAPMHRELKKLQEEALLARAKAAEEDDEE